MTLFKHNQTEHQAAIAMQRWRSHVPHQVNRPLFAPLIGYVSAHALYKMLNELEKSTRPDFDLKYTGTFRKTMGLLRALTLRHCVSTGRSIYTTNVHRHWHFDPQQGSDKIQLLLGPRPLNPLPVRTNSAQA